MSKKSQANSSIVRCNVLPAIQDSGIWVEIWPLCGFTPKFLALQINAVEEGCNTEQIGKTNGAVNGRLLSLNAWLVVALFLMAMPVTSCMSQSLRKEWLVKYVVGIFEGCVMAVQFCLYHFFLFHLVYVSCR
jgi:sterol desaturase/sphingolipid hydroxylase (fatty acid hydroxylase superfamily)